MNDVVAELEVHDGDERVFTGKDIVSMGVMNTRRFSGEGSTSNAVCSYAAASFIVDGVTELIHFAFAAPDGGAVGTIRRGGRARCLGDNGIVPFASEDGAVHAEGDAVVACAAVDLCGIVRNDDVLARAAVDGAVRASDDAVVACARISAIPHVITIDEVEVRC